MQQLGMRGVCVCAVKSRRGALHLLLHGEHVVAAAMLLSTCPLVFPADHDTDLCLLALMAYELDCLPFCLTWLDFL
jgi:hypothetical protein